MLRNSKIKLVLFLSLWAFAQRAGAQLKYSVEHYSTADGLSDNRIRTIIKDREGFMWFGTWAGINRFDGNSFLTFKSYPGDRSPLKSDRIDDIVEDRSGHLWVRAYDGQIYMFSKKNGRFHAVTDILNIRGPQPVFKQIIISSANDVWLVTESSGLYVIPNARLQRQNVKHFYTSALPASRLPSDTVLFLKEDSKHRIWIGTARGTVVFEQKPGSAFQKRNLNGTVNKMICTAADEDRINIWLIASNGYLLAVNKQNFGVTARRISAAPLNDVHVSAAKGKVLCTTATGELVAVQTDFKKTSTLKLLCNQQLLSIYEDKKGILWLEPSKDGIVKLDLSSGKSQLLAGSNLPNFFRAAGSYWIFEDVNGLLWANLKGLGLSYYDSKADSFTKLSYHPGDIKNDISDGASAFFYDPAGVLWVGSDQGIEKAVFPPSGFRQNLLVQQSTSKAENEVRGLYTLYNGSLWLGTKAGKVYLYKRGQTLPVQLEGPAGGFSGIYSVLEDSRGRIWLGTKENGLFKAERQPNGAYALTRYFNKPADPFSINSNVVYALLEDRYGRIWVGTFGGGLNILDETGGNARFINANNELKNYPGHSFFRIRSLATDQAGNVWIGTSQGLLIAPMSNNKSSKLSFSIYTKKPGEINSLGGNDVQYVYKDPQNRMWVATSSGGLNKAVFNNASKSLHLKIIPRPKDCPATIS